MLHNICQFNVPDKPIKQITKNKWLFILITLIIDRDYTENENRLYKSEPVVSIPLLELLLLWPQSSQYTSSEDLLMCQSFLIRGHSKTTWTRFWPFLTTYLPTYLDVDIFYPKRGQKEAFFDHLPTSSCPRSFWTTPMHIQKMS